MQNQKKKSELLAEKLWILSQVISFNHSFGFSYSLLCIWLDILDKLIPFLFETKLVLFFHLNRYETLVGTIGKKFAKKRDRAIYEEDENGDIKPIKAKKMFFKPQD